MLRFGASHAGSPESRASVSRCFFPHNDAGTIASLVIQAQEAIRQLTPDFEIIVVNDGSRDQTGRSPPKSSLEPIPMCG